MQLKNASLTIDAYQIENKFQKIIVSTKPFPLDCNQQWNQKE